MQPSSNTKFYTIIGILTSLLFISFAWIIYSTTIGTKKPGSSSLNSTSTYDQTFFDTQNASVNGKIAKIAGNNVTIENKKKGSIEAVVSPEVIITDNSTGEIASPSGDLKNIKLNTETFINFQFINGKFQVTNITFMPETPPAFIDPNNLPKLSSPPPPPKPAKPGEIPDGPEATATSDQKPKPTP